MLTEQFRHQIGYRPSPAEIHSWQRSLPVLAQDLADAGLESVEVLVEYRLPLSSKRIDAVLAGSHPKTGRASYVVVELKQWSRAWASDESADLVRVDGYGQRPVLHPVEQVRRYTEFLRDFTRALEHEDDAVVGAAYLHNAKPADVDTLSEYPITHHARMFTGGGRGEWLDFLSSRLAPTPGAPAADLLISSRIAPSRNLLSVAAEEIQSREQFILLDEQQVAYSTVSNAVKRARESDRKTTVVVTGGPGSGKSVIALSLVGEMSRQGYSAMHATGSKSFTTTMRRVAGHRNKRVQGLFAYFNSFMKADRNGLDLLICDEAHRIREESANRYTRAADRSGKPQIEELLDAARVPVFLLDEHQVVRPGELGTVAVIRAAAQKLGHTVQEINLDGQFRSGGSRAYEEWVLRLLGLAPGGPIPWEGDERFEVSVVATPQEMEETLEAKLAEGHSARISAGFCWPWSDPLNGELINDVKIGSWARPWNNKEDRAVGGAPPTSLWASQEGGFGQIGCVYTAQGFEYDWSGVILGPDLVWREGRFVSDVSASRDPAFRGKAAASFDEFVRNVYKVLLTRGMMGTVITSTDAQTREFLETLA